MKRATGSALLLAVAAALLPLVAEAHSPIKGVAPFYGGVAHPFVVPAHVMAMITLGLFIGRQPAERLGDHMVVVIAALLAGVTSAGWAGDPDTDVPLLVTVCLMAVAVAWPRPWPRALVNGAVGAVALLIALGSAPDGITGTPRRLHLAGCCMGVLLGVCWVCIVAEHARRPWQQIAVRVVASWMAASSLLVMALAVVGPARLKQAPASQRPSAQKAVVTSSTAQHLTHAANAAYGPEKRFVQCCAAACSEGLLPETRNFSNGSSTAGQRSSAAGSLPTHCGHPGPLMRPAWRRFSLRLGRRPSRSRARLHSNRATLGPMKTAQLPPVRVEPSVREEIEAVLREGESLSEFVETAAVEAARRRKAQDEFLARGRASLAKAKRTGKFHDAQAALAGMQGRLESAVETLKKGKRPTGAGQ